MALITRFPAKAKGGLVSTPLYDRTLIDRDAIKALSRINPWRGLLSIVTQWAVIIWMVNWAMAAQQWWVTLIAIVVIATRQLALTVLMHEGSHNLVFKNPVLNNFMVDFFCTFPNGASTHMYRQQHMLHHAKTGETDDVELILREGITNLPIGASKSKIIWFFIRALFGFKSGLAAQMILLVSPFYFVRFAGKKRASGELAAFLAYWGTIAFGLTITHTWPQFFLFWVLPLWTVNPCLNFIRLPADHHFIKPGDHELTLCRTVKANWLEKFFIAPLNVHYHLDHHLFPSIPQYNLPKLHRLLMQEETYRQNACIAQGYIGGEKSLLAMLSTPSS